MGQTRKLIKKIARNSTKEGAGTYRAPIHSLGNNLAAVWIHHNHRDGRKLVGLGCLDGKRCHLIGKRQCQSLRRSEYCHCVFLGVQEDTTYETGGRRGNTRRSANVLAGNLSFVASGLVFSFNPHPDSSKASFTKSS